MKGRNGFNSASGSLISQVSPKVIVAAVLLSLMGLMWLRILLQKETVPRAAGAATATSVTSAQSKKPSFTAKPRPPAIQKGYHDRLYRDPFDSAQAWWYTDKPQGEPRSPATLSPEEERRRVHEADLWAIADSLTLEAIILNADGSRRAFIEGKVVTEGSTLTVVRNGSVYELTAQSVSDTEVVFTWQAFSITVHMAPFERVDARKDGVL